MGAAGQPALSAEAQAALDGRLVDAARQGDAAAIERLAAEGASPNAKGGYDGSFPAVWVAVEKGHAGAVSALVRLGADLDARGVGLTGLMWAASDGQVECARALLAGGADRTLRATGPAWAEGKTALELAEWRDNAEVAALLREPESASMRQARQARKGCCGCCVIC